MTIPDWPCFDLDQIEAASTILASGKVNYWTGEEGRLFEKEFSKWCGTSQAIALSNGSLALSACYESINLAPGDEIITSPRTFIATASSAVLSGAIPRFADVSRESGVITVETIEPLINKRTKAISVVHLGGWPADMEAICKLAKHYKLYVIEDCAQSHGAKLSVNGRYKSVGSFGDLAAWSFCQDKIMTTGGEGGMVTTSNLDLWESIWSYKDHGKSWDAVFNRKHDEGYRFVHETIGTNFRLTEFQSAIGRIQLKKMSEWTHVRKRNAKILSEALKPLTFIRVPIVPNDIEHAWYKYYCYLKLDELKSDWSRNRIVSEIKSHGYPAFHGSCGEIYLEKCFKSKNLTPVERLPVAKELGETSLMFLVHPTISAIQMSDYAELIRSVLVQSVK